MTASFAGLVERLSAASVTRRRDVYRDIAWDDPELGVDADDRRWVLPAWDPLGGTEWYRDQPATRRSAIGLHRVVVQLKVGIVFEAVLQKGLLDLAAQLPSGDPAFRYLYHEVIEEAQHSMMFQELINRSGLPAPGEALTPLGAITGEVDGDWSMFFLGAISGEEVFDRIQRRWVAESSTHPLFRRICEIHVAEEARHLSFARAYLRERLLGQSDDARRLLRYRAPFVIDAITRFILALESPGSPEVQADVLADTWGMPSDVRDQLRDGEAARRLRRECASGVVRLCRDLDLVDPRLSARWVRIEAGA